MVQRSSQELNINTGGQVSAQQSGVGFATPDPNKYSTGQQFDAPMGAEDSAASRLLGRLVGAGDKLAEQGFKQSTEEAYLSGMAQAGKVQSEAELQANPITRDWAVGGYRDTMGRINAADVESQIAADMPRMREASPEKFGEYMAEKRQALTDSWSGMTGETRKTMFAQQMLSERSWVRKHAVEHQKFVLEAEQRSIKTGVETSLATLTAAKSDATTYEAATTATMGTIYSSIVANPKLPPAMRGQVLAQVAGYALEQDHQALYHAMHNQNVPIPGSDKEAPMSSLMSWEDDTALSKEFRQSEQRTEAFRAADFMDRSARMEADWASPNTPLMPVAQVEQHLQEGIQRRLINADQYHSMKKDYYEKSEKKLVQGQLASAWAAGDQDTLLRLGKTSQEGLDAYVDTLGRKMQLPQIVDSLLTIGATTGQGEAYRKVGQLMAPAFAQIGNNDQINPANALAISGTLQKIDQAEKAGKAGAFHQFLTAFDPEVQAKITYMRDNLAKNADPTTAIAAATAQVLEESKMTPAMRAELTVAKSKDLIKALDDVTPRGMLGTGWLYAKSFLSPTKQGRENASATLATTPYQGWLENDDRVAEVAASSKLALAQSMDDIAKTNPHLSTSSIVSMAKADVAGRSVPTGWGPLTVPKGFSPQRYFGVGQDVGAERIGVALDEYIKPQAGGRMSFRIGVNGELMYQELNDHGKPAAPARTIDPKAVGPMVEAQRSRVVDEFKLNHGEGVATEVNGVKLQYNGDNSANVDNAWMRRLRDDITTSGTLKVDPASHLPAAAVSAALMQESNAAAKQAVRIMMVTGTKGEPAFKLFGSIAFQADFKDKAYDRLVLAMRNKNLESAQKALELTPMYRSIAGNRKQYLMTNLIAAMKG